jgi:AcrR family transcriptional regulator
MKKGEDTKQTILEYGLQLASQVGLESVTIGVLAKETGMSKSGLFAHFQSKENLQVEILEHAAREFSDNVVVPALKQPFGIPRIKALVENWIAWGANMEGGCVFVSASTEYTDRPGRVRKVLLKQQETWIDTLKRLAKSAIKAGDFRKEIDCGQFAFELYSLMLGFHYYHKLLQDSDTKKRQETALAQLLSRYRQKHP